MRRKALVVLGMHRSGTSALTRALNLAGSFLPASILPAVPGENDRGFWEPERLVEADKRALAAAGVSWDSPARIDPSWFAGEAGEAAIAELARVFDEDFAGHDQFVVKDPRLCRLVPLARSALDRCGIDTAYILILRHPSAVAASLAARNLMPRGHAQRLWLRYVLDAERSTRGLRRVVIGFDELMSNWRATLTKVGRTLDVTLATGPGIDGKIASFLDPALVHHADRTGEALSVLVGAAWDALRTLQAGGESKAACDELDRIARVLDGAEAMLDVTSARADEKSGTTPSASQPPLLAQGGESLKPSPPAGGAAPAQAGGPLKPSPPTRGAVPAQAGGPLKPSPPAGGAVPAQAGGPLKPSPPAGGGVPAQAGGVVGARASSSVAKPIRKTFRHLIASGLFHSGYYRASNPDVTGNPAWHYLTRGRGEGRSPHPLFDPAHYARAAGIEHLPRGRWFSHFLAEGEARGISPHPLVDLHRLARGYGIDGPLRGLLAQFARDPEPPCNPHPLFDVRYYLGRYPDVAASGINPLVHYLLHGAAEERQPSAWFDERYYRSRLATPIPTERTPLQHYVEVGGPAGISPSPRFDPGAYAMRHPEDARAGTDLLSACLDRYHGRVPDEFAPPDAGPARPTRILAIAPGTAGPTAADPKLAYWLRRQMSLDLFDQPGFWTSLVPRIGFAVTRADDAATAGDYFTALELALALERRMPCKPVFLEMERGDPYDASGLDVLIVMRDDYELDQVRHRPPRLITIGWARNWIDRWAARPWAQDYAAVWASSAKAADTLSRRLARPVEIIAIAAGRAFLDDGTAHDELRSDYCFTGNYWNDKREISEWLNPDALPYRFAVYGHGWDNHPTFSRHARGGLPYSRMKDVYASTRVVVDDANSVTKQWASVNSRVYDALAAGALVITNGIEGARATFGDLLPTYSSPEELHSLLKRYLADEPARVALVEQLRRKVAESHTYAHRAGQVEQLLRRLSGRQFRIAIKIGTPSQAVREEWGDYHFAVGLRRALTRRGHGVRVDCIEDWDRPDAVGDDVVIVLRGLSRYEPKPHQVNLMWNISHPDKVDDEEYERYDHVFVASVPYARTLAGRLRVPVTALLQCTDPALFNPDVPRKEGHEMLFVGNSRKVLRPVVKDAIAANLPLSVFGTRWQGLIPPRYLKGDHVANRDLAGYYAAAGVVLNDHWDAMREHGFLSNRLFDAAACGARIVTDRIEGIGEVFGELVLQYEGPDELATAVERLLKEPAENRTRQLALARQVMREHSFDARTRSILAVVLEQDRTRMTRFPGS